MSAPTVSAKAFTQNFASAKVGWLARSLVLVVRVTLGRPDFILCTELYANRRARITKRLAKRYACAGYYYGKVIYVRRTRWAVISRPHKVRLGNRKHGLAIRVQDRHSGAWLTVAVAHLSWAKSSDTKRERQTMRLVHSVDKHFGTGPALFGGDWNSSIHKGSRKRDAVGEVMRRLGLSEAYRKAPKRSHVEFNSANQYRRPAPSHSIHLDRFFGRHLTWLSWTLDYYTGRYGSDHFGVAVTFQAPIVKGRVTT